MPEITNMQDYSFKFSDVVGDYLSKDTVDIKDRLDRQPKEVREFVVGLVNLLNSINGADYISAKGFDGLKTTIQAMLNDLNTRKLDQGSDFTGTWQGLRPSQAEPGLSALVDSHTEQLNDITKDITDGGLDRIKATGQFLTNMNSWIGLLNTKYTADNATRFYLLPKGKVTTGVGGCFKIFADDYQNGADYRDLGIYFHADQNGDKGYYGNGVNWINVKVLDGGQYAGKHPDLGFSFQDGAVIAGRITCFNNTRPVWIFGSGKPSVLNTSLIAEFQGNLGITKGNGFKLMTADDTKAHTISDDTDDTLKWSILNGEKKYINGTQTLNNTLTISEFKNAVVTSSRKNVTTDGTSIDVTGFNRVVLNQPSTGNNIDTITGGVDGQEIILIQVAGNSSPQHTTIVNGTTIKLQGATNFAMGYNNTLTLINISGTWYEKCRSVNG